MDSRLSLPPFTSDLSRLERILVLCWLPVHIALLPWILNGLGRRGLITEASANFLYYAIGFVYMLLVGFRFLRRDFDPLADRPLYVAGTVSASYLMMLALNGLVGFLILHFLPESENPNNAAVTGLVLGGARQLDSELTVDIAREPRAIESLGPPGAVTIGRSYVLVRLFYDEVCDLRGA